MMSDKITREPRINAHKKRSIGKYELMGSVLYHESTLLRRAMIAGKAMDDRIATTGTFDDSLFEQYFSDDIARKRNLDMGLWKQCSMK